MLGGEKLPFNVPWEAHVIQFNSIFIYCKTPEFMNIFFFWITSYIYYHSHTGTPIRGQDNHTNTYEYR